MDHPAQGLIKFSRVSGSLDCFGCDVLLDGYVQLEINTARVQKGIGKEYYITGSNVLRLRLTNYQFLELITNLNNGRDIPCTLEVVKGDPVGRYEKTETVLDDFKRSTVELSNECFELVVQIQTQLQELDAAKTPSKRKINKVKRDMENLHTRLKEDIPWLQNRFHEDMLVMFTQIKEEASAWIQNKLMEMGLDKVTNKKKLK